MGGKNGGQISGFSKKKKKYVQLICADKIFKTVCGNVFEINSSQDI